VVERAVCGGCHGELCFLWEGNEMVLLVLLHISLGIDSLDTCIET